ncbi:hypothetical protein SLEP1_g917 [Rubroshorea leprosula]|nr:hypothetical protein SLEP1_g917 [Rubroshorea leprosula]
MGTARLGEDSLNELERLRNNLAILNWIFPKTRVKRTDRAIEFWLDGLTDAAYDLVDVLNEWNAAHGRFRIKGVGKTSILKAKVGSFVTHCLRTTQVVRRDDLAFKLKKFSDRLDEIATDLNKYHLISISTSSRWIESTFVDVSQIIGRDEVKGDILDPDGLKSTWKVHDILHDFAQFLMNNDGIVIEVNPGGNSVIDLSSRNARYLTACIPEGHCLPTSIYGAEKLRSLMIISGENAITNEAVRIIFNQAKQLRLVDFGCHNASMDTIPKEIGNLIRLRHINFSGSKIKRLPPSLCELYNLQYLNLDNCESLENLPDEIGNLINLRHIICSGSKIKGLPPSLCKLHNLRYLNLDNCKALENLPDEIGDLINLIHLGTLHCYSLACYPKSARYLSNLRRLRGIVLRADRNDPKEFALGDLENLNKLCELSMVLKGNAVDDRELKRAKFEKKIYLEEIKVE